MDKKKGYQHYVSDVKEDTDFLSKIHRHLVSSLDELDQILNTKYKDSKFMAFDIETSDLNPIEGFIVGYSFAFDAVDGYYVPVKHQSGGSLGEDALKLIYDRMCLNTRNFIYNMMFDYNFMEYEGELRSKYTFDMSKAPYYDVMVGMFLADTNVPFPGLKKMAHKFLGWNMESFESTLGDNWNFFYLDAKDAYNYGAIDSIATFALAPHSLKFYKEAKLSGKIDNDFLYPFMQCLKEGVRQDTAYLEKVKNEQEVKIQQIEQEIFKIVGYQFRINSNKELSEALLSLGIDTGVRTKPGYLKSDIETLLTVNRTKPHPVIDLLVEYKQLNKSISSYTKTLYEYSKVTEENRLRYCYHLFIAPTCRLASGKDGKNSYYTAINVQSIPKPHSKNWYVHDYKEGDTLQEGDVVVLDWRFSLVEESNVMIEGLDPHWNLRKSFLPEKNSYWVSMDYSAEELRCIANYSKEPLWINTFLNNGDLHRSMAAKIFHKPVEEVTGDERKKAKSSNFGLAYGMSPYTMINRFNLPLSECEELHKGWWDSVPHIKAFQQRYIKLGRKTGTVYNYLGRPRRVKHYYSCGDRKQEAFGDRTIRNTVIQSMGADILKISIIKLYSRLYSNPKYKSKCRFLNTVHDECNSSISYKNKEEFLEMLKVHYDCMYTKFKGWDVPFELGIEIGPNWGESFPFLYKEGKLVPDTYEVKSKQSVQEAPKEVVQEDEVVEFNINW